MKRWLPITALLLAAVAAFLVFTHPQKPAVKEAVSLSPSPTPLPSVSSPVSLLFVGDIMLSRSVGDYMLRHNDWLWPFAKVASITAGADLTFGNLETTISTRGAVNGCGYCFRSDPRVLAGLTKAGFDVMSVANNHIWDYGPQAFTDTLGALATADISPVGGGRDETEARTAVVREVRGTRIAYLAYTNMLPAAAQAGPSKAGVAPWNMDNMKQDISAARARADVVIVSFHTGTEYQTVHNPDQESIYQAAVDDGADLVIGTHPHVVQEVLPYKHGWIAYSLGNFVFDQDWSTATTRGLAIQATIKDKKVGQVQLLPVNISKAYQSSFGI
jgi:poly-gamma-glutamate capsule biosynthesis protein CapA/YwtB (metallophosphatase superfamily)